MSDKLSIQSSLEGSRAVLTLDGRLGVHSSEDLASEIEKLPDGVRDIDIDFSHVTYVASAGIRVLLIAAKQCDDRGGTLRILHPSEDAVEPFGLASLELVLNIVP